MIPRPTEDQRTTANGRGDIDDGDSESSETGLEWREIVKGSRVGDRHVRIGHHPGFQRLRPGIITPREGKAEPATRIGKLIDPARRLLLGTPIPSSAESEERVRVPRGLAIFASDNISSSAYATEELMRVLMIAGVGALSLTLPITLAVIMVLGVVIISYLQVIQAYPDGGGSYVVAHENLGPLAGLIAAAALLTDYILTVAVSVSAGVAALSSAFPGIYNHRVGVALAVILGMTVVNLRGIRESGQIFSIPTYLYMFSVLALLGYGMFRYVIGDLPDFTTPVGWTGEWRQESGVHALSVLLVLRAFASGSVALTGTEAVSNGVPAFQRPEVRNAQTTLIAMGAIFTTIFVGFSFLARQIGVIPDPNEVETVNSLITRSLVGDGAIFFIVQFSTALLLVLAGNTAFNGFPMLASILAKDRYLPRQFSYRGDRLSFTGGILLLAVIAGLLVWIYQASVTNLIPLYTVGVFIAFTLSQSGLIRYWSRARETVSSWKWRLGANALGAVVTGVVAIVVGVSKFLLGAWMVLILIPILVWIMWHIHRHYESFRRIEEAALPVKLSPGKIDVRIVVPVANLGAPSRQAIAYGLAIAPHDHVTVLHITDQPEEEDELRRQWRELEWPGQFVVIESPYRSLLAPLVAYVNAVMEVHPESTMTVVLPEYVPRHWWEHLLHNQTALRLKAALLFRPNIVVTNVPFHVS
ncbi:MAG: APC family permease [Thermomicrobiales bacterium]